MTSRGKRWWEKPGPHREGRQGRVATVRGTDTAIACPKCGQFPVVYNGNYFCDNWAWRPGPDDCDWAMPHPSLTDADRRICDLIGVDYS